MLLSFHFLRLMTCSMIIVQKHVWRVKFSTAIHVKCNDIYLKKAWAWGLHHENPACKKLVQGCKIWLYIYPFFSGKLIWTYGFVVKESKSGSRNMGLIPLLYWKSLLLLGHVEWHWASQWTETRSFTLLAVNLLLLSCAGRVLVFNTSIWLQLLWSTWSQALGLAHEQ